MKTNYAHHVTCSCGNEVLLCGNEKQICDSCGATVWVTEIRDDNEVIYNVVPHVKNPKHNVIPEYLYSMPYSD